MTKKQITGAPSIAFRRLLWPLFCFALVQTASARDDWIFDIRTGVIYDSNVSHSDRSADRKADAAWRSVLTAGQGFQLTDDLRLGVFGKVEGEVWGTYSGLNNIRPGAEANLRYRFGLGKNAPWIRFETELAYADFADEGRSGVEFRPGLSAGVGLTERFRVDATYGYDRFAAREAVWEHDGHSVSVHGRIQLTSSMQMVIGYAYRYGDVNSAAVPPRPDIVAIADVSELIDTFDEPYMAYRFPASTHIGSIAVSQALSSFAAIQASYDFQYTTHDPLHYINHVAELALAISF